MSNGEVISIVAVILSFIGVASSFMFSYKKADRERDQEREESVQIITEIKNDMHYLKNNIIEIKTDIKSINSKMESDHEKLIEHETKIKNLEKEVFKK